jgi:hypothetical protein
VDNNTYQVCMAAIACVQTIALAYLGVQGYKTHQLVNGQASKLEDVAHAAGVTEGRALADDDSTSRG